MPASRACSAPHRVPAYMSSGEYFSEMPVSTAGPYPAPVIWGVYPPMAPCRLDHLSGGGRGLEIGADGSNDAVCHQDVAHWQVAQVRVDRHDVPALDQQLFRQDLSLYRAGAHVLHGAVPACP